MKKQKRQDAYDYAVYAMYRLRDAIKHALASGRHWVPVAIVQEFCVPFTISVTDRHFFVSSHGVGSLVFPYTDTGASEANAVLLAQEICKGAPDLCQMLS